jgi:pyruvate dehydrogenase E2 component (dihydrolipoamide acetyltransferase)
MAISIRMPALSPTMEEGTLARWLVKAGDKVSSGDIMAEIETDKATMEFEAVDEGTIASIAIAEGTEGVKVGTVIAVLAEEGEDPGTVKDAAQADEPAAKAETAEEPAPAPEPAPVEATPAATRTPAPSSGARIIASPLAKRIAADRGIDLAAITGSGPHGRIVKADLETAGSGAAAPAPMSVASVSAALSEVPDFGIPFEAEKLNNVRKVIARRLTEAKQTIPHIYLTLDIRLDPLLELRADLNAALAADNIKLSVNDLLIKALGKALQRVPQCNVSFAGDVLRKYSRVDV